MIKWNGSFGLKKKKKVRIFCDLRMLSLMLSRFVFHVETYCFVVGYRNLNESLNLLKACSQYVLTTFSYVNYCSIDK